jgi:acetyltransferase-like isoleucine patch superfamily enzyme/coenzyme F420-reducing hydrogenase beta subunit
MIDIKNKVDCCGCNACGDVCVHGAITFNTDNEGFWYPVVDKQKCVDCHLCEKVCPVINAKDLKVNEFKTPKCVVANHKNIEVRFDSTSGGMFTAYAEWAFKNGYYVGGAIWTESFGAVNYISNNKDDLEKLRNTKYFQSDAQGFYKQVKKLLQAGEKVLICNLPCQIAALKAYLHKEYENLITVDLFCRGINSPMVFRKFLEALENKYNSKVVYVKPKSKDLGWHRLTLKIVFENGQTYYGTCDIDFYTRAFLLSNCISRPSCYECKFKGFPRVADLSIGDFWRASNVNTRATKLDDNLGTSAILINSLKGETLMNNVSKKLQTEEESFEVIVAGNPALVSSIAKEKVDRKLFYEKINNEDFLNVVEYLFPKKLTIKDKLKNIAKALFFEIVRYAQFRPKPIWQFVKYNFLCRQVKNSSIVEGRLFYITRFCDIELHKGSVLRLNGSFTFGTSVFKHTHKESRLRVMPGGIMTIDGDWSCGDGANIEVFSTGQLTIKRSVWANVNLCIICMDKILLDEWAMIGRDVTIRDNNGGHPIGIYGSRTKMPVIIGKHVWLTSNCTVMMGVKIGDGTIVGSDSLVTSSVPANCIVNGSPAKVTQTNILWRM